MPFKSQAQRRFLYAKHPEIAKKWEKHTLKDAKLPKYAKKKKKSRRKGKKKSNLSESLFDIALRETLKQLLGSD